MATAAVGVSMINELIQCDCMDYMRTCKDKQFDLSIVDPPYGIMAASMSMGSTHKRGDGLSAGEDSTAVKLRRRDCGSGKLKNRILNTKHCDWDNSPPDDNYFSELFRISKNQIIWGYNYFKLPPCRGIIVWDKVQPWENFSQVELAWTSFDMPAKLIKLSNTGGNNSEKKIHPTQKPFDIYKSLLLKYAKIGDKLLDTHSGSGSFRIAAYDMGFDLTSCEIDADYCRDNEARYQAHIMQQELIPVQEIQQLIFNAV